MQGVVGLARFSIFQDSMDQECQIAIEKGFIDNLTNADGHGLFRLSRFAESGAKDDRQVR
jgi:hypothetical protein